MEIDKLETAARFNSLAAKFSLTKKGNAYYSNYQEVEFICQFDISYELFVELVENNLNRFSDLDYYIDKMHSDPAVRELVELVKSHMNEQIKNMKKSNDYATRDIANTLESQSYDADKNSSVAEKLHCIFLYFGTEIMINDDFLLDDKPFLVSRPSNIVCTTEQILNLVPLSEFRLDIHRCNWDLDEPNVIILNFDHR